MKLCFTLLWTLIIGLARQGALAKFIMPGKDPGGIVITTLLGVAGSFVGSWIGRLLGLYADGQSADFLMSLAGAIVLLILYRLIRRPSPALR